MTTSNMRCSFSRLFPGATVAHSREGRLRWIKSNRRLVAPNCRVPRCHVAYVGAPLANNALSAVSVGRHTRTVFELRATVGFVGL